MTMQGVQNKSSSSLTPEEIIYDVAMELWFCPREKVTTQELKKLSRDQREFVWADLSGDSRLSRHQRESKRHDCSKSCEKSRCEYIVQMDEKLLDLNENSEDMGIASNDESSSPSFSLPRHFSDAKKLAFLRAERWDPGAAAIRLQKYRLLVDSYSSSPSTDLNRQRHSEVQHSNKRNRSLFEQNGVDCSQHVYLLNERDKADRKVLVVRLDCLSKLETTVATQLLWSTLVPACYDTESIVSVLYLPEDYQAAALSYENIRCFWNMTRAIPTRFAAIYVVHHDPRWTPVVNSAIELSYPWLRVRTRSLQGSLTECLYTLSCVGVPTQVLREDTEEPTSTN